MQNAEAEAFEEAFNPSPEPAPAEKETEKADEGGQPRDEQGRFAGKEPEGETEQADEGSDTDEGEAGRVPAWRLRELREERDRDRARAEQAERQALDFQRQLAELQQQRQVQEQQVEPPDPVYDPAGYRQYVAEAQRAEANRFQDALRDRMIDMTFADAHEQHGKTFEEAYSGLQQAVARNDPEAQRIINAPNPGKALMRWHRQRSAMTQIGDDLDGFLTKKQDEWLKDPKVRERVIQMAREDANGSGNGRSSNITDLPSLNRAPGGAGNRSGGSLGDTDEERFDNAFAPRRRG